MAQLICAGELRTLRYSFWLRWKGLDFSGESCEKLGLSATRAAEHAHSAGPQLEEVIQNLDVPRDANIIDLGSGKGLAAITLSKEFQHVLGVELHPGLVEVARRNVAKLGIKNISFLCADAGTFKGFDEFAYLYMFNPFYESIMVEVMKNLNASLQSKAREMTIIYKNPFCHQILVDAGFGLMREIQYPHSHPFKIYRKSSVGSVKPRLLIG